MELVRWNEALSEGHGQSGSRYALCFERSDGAATGGCWRIDVDGAEICRVESAASAVRRAEGLEAIRCIIRGLSAALSEEQLRYAAAIAREMTAAADQAATTAPAGDRAPLLHSADSLRSLSDAIGKECARRAREDDAVLPRPH